MSTEAPYPYPRLYVGAYAKEFSTLYPHLPSLDCLELQHLSAAVAIERLRQHLLQEGAAVRVCTAVETLAEPVQQALSLCLEQTSCKAVLLAAQSDSITPTLVAHCAIYWQPPTLDPRPRAVPLTLGAISPQQPCTAQYQYYLQGVEPLPYVWEVIRGRRTSFTSY